MWHRSLLYSRLSSYYVVIQAARLNGFSPIIATSSARHSDWLKSLGATHVLDRSLPPTEIKDKLSSLTGDKPIEFIYDAWGRDRESARLGYTVLAPGGAFATVIPQELTDLKDLIEESEKRGEGKRVAQAWASFWPGNEELGDEIYQRLSGWLETGAIVVSRVVHLLVEILRLSGVALRFLAEQSGGAP